MLEGIEILSQYTKTLVDGWPIFLIVLGAMFMLIFGPLAIFVAIEDWGWSKHYRDTPIHIFFATLFIIGAVVLGTGIIGNATGHSIKKEVIYYKVTVSDDVSMNEFSKRYKVLETDGRIYTITEREDTNDSSKK